jgi:polar amino acid transport system substrate-binding protein
MASRIGKPRARGKHGSRRRQKRRQAVDKPQQFDLNCRPAHRSAEAFPMTSTPPAATQPSAAARADLAPHGTLRLAFPMASALYVSKDAATGALKGIALDLGAELAARLGVSFEPQPCTAVRELIAATGTDRWDVAALVQEAERETMFDYSRPYMVADSTYLVPAGSPIRSVPEADRPGTRIGAAAKSAFANYLARTLRNATLLQYSGIGAVYDALRAGEVDLVAAPRQVLAAAQDRFPGARILDDWFDVARVGIVAPKGRQAAGLAFVNTFIGELIASGWIAQAIARSGLKGVKVPAD